MEKIRKSDQEYLNQLRGNTEEKIGDLIRALENDELPEINGVIRVLEVGVGSGDSIERLRYEIKDPTLEIVGTDLIEGLVVRVHNPDQQVFGVVSDLSDLPFGENSISGINISSVLHEAISYNEKLLSGKIGVGDYISTVFKKLNTVLAPEGKIFYRDVGYEGGEGALLGRYSPELQYFITNFDRDFREKFHTLFDKEAKFEVIQNEEGVHISASRHYHREVQRHLISYLDYAARQKFSRSFKEVLRTSGHTENFYSAFRGC